MHAAANLVADLCATLLIALFAWAVVVMAAYTWETTDWLLPETKRQIQLTRRLLAERPAWKTRRQCYLDARWIRQQAAPMAAELRRSTDGLTADQVRFQADVELTLWLIPTVEEVA